MATTVTGNPAPARKLIQAVRAWLARPDWESARGAIEANTAAFAAATAATGRITAPEVDRTGTAPGGTQ